MTYLLSENTLIHINWIGQQNQVRVIFSSCFCLRQSGPAFKSDEPRPTLKGQVGPRILKHDQDTVTEAYQVEDVYGKPQDPGKKTCDPQFAYFYHTVGASHCGHIAFVEVVKWV